MSRRRRSPEVIDVDAYVAMAEPEVPAVALDALQAITGASMARCKHLLLGADLDVERAMNHYFDQQESKSGGGSSSSQPAAAAATAAAAAAASRPRTSRKPAAKRAQSLPPAKKPTASKAPRMQPATKSARKKKKVASSDDDEEEILEKAIKSASAASAAAAAAFYPEISSARQVLARAARPTTFKKKAPKQEAKKAASTPKKSAKRKKLNSDDDESESSNSEFTESEDSEAFGSSASLSDDSDGASFFALFQRRRAPANPFGRRRGANAAAAAAAPAGGRRRRGGAAAAGAGGGWGRRGRAAAAAIKAENNRIITSAVVRAQLNDTDEARLAQVQQWHAPPRAIDVAAVGLAFPERFAYRERWRVGTLIDCNLNDGRGWCEARIVNIVSQHRSFALSYDVSFEDRRVDVLPGTIFRFSAMDSMYIDGLNRAEDADDRFQTMPSEEARVIARQKAAAKKKNNNAAAADNPEDLKFTIADFHVRQLIDVRIGDRWFLGQVTDSKFSMIPDGDGVSYTDVLDVLLLDFHSDCARRYTRAQLDQLHPIAFTHRITHYPLACLPEIRTKEPDITVVYAQKKAGFAWANERLNFADDDDEEEKKKDDEEEAVLSFNSEAPAAPAAAAAAAAPAPRGRAARAVVAAPAPPLIPVLARPLGVLELNVVSDADFHVGEKNPRYSKLLERAVPCFTDDPLCTADERGRPLSREQSLRRLLAILEFARNGMNTYVRTELRVKRIKIGERPTLLASRAAVRHNEAERYQKLIDAEFWNHAHLRYNSPYHGSDWYGQRQRNLTAKLRTIEKKQAEARKKALADGTMPENESDFAVSEDDEPEPQLPPPKNKKPTSVKKEVKKAAESEDEAPESDYEDWLDRIESALMASSVASDYRDEDYNEEGYLTPRAKHQHLNIVDDEGILRWYHLEMSFELVRREARDPKKTSQEASSTNELLLLLFPHSKELRRLSREATRPMPAYLPNTISLDGLLKHSAHYHHALAEKESQLQQEQKEEMKDVEPPPAAAAAAAVPAAPAAALDGHQTNAEALSAVASLTVTLKDYQVQTLNWMLRAESPDTNVSAPFWCTLYTVDGCAFQYSPFLQRFTFSPHPDIKGGWICEEMGLGKTIEMLALLNMKSAADIESAHAEARIALGEQRNAAPAAAAASPAVGRMPVVRDAYGTYISRATLIICPVSLISQWVAELREKSTKPLRILQYHGKRTSDPRDLVDYDIVITAYSILSTESRMIAVRSKREALMEPWAYEGAAGLKYASPLSQVHWRRIVLDEGHSVKNVSAECSQLASKLLGRCRYMMSGTPFGSSLMDLKGQTRFLGLTGFAGTFLFNSLYRFMHSQPRYSNLAEQLRTDDCNGTPYRVHEWLKRFRNVFTWLVTRCMIRHEKSMVFRGRNTLLVLPDARVEVVYVDLTPTQRAAYKLLYEFACKRFAAFKESGDAVAKTIEVLQLLVPLRQVCSVDTVDIDEVKRRLRDLARGIAIGGPVGGQALAPSIDFPQATTFAFGSLKDECTVCLDVLEDAVQTACNHLFCKECIFAMCDSRGAEATCPICRSPLSPHQLCAPLIHETDQERQAREAKEHAEQEAKSNAVAHMTDADAPAAVAAGSSSTPPAAAASAAASSPAAAAKKTPTKKRRRNDSDDEEEYKDGSDGAFGENEERKSVEDEEMHGAEEQKEEEISPDSIHGRIIFDSKLNALIAELRAMKAADPTAKALVFTQFRSTMDTIQSALKTENIKHEMLMGHFTLSQRKRALENFKSNPDTAVFLLSVRAAAAGLTLTSANYVYIVEPGLNPAITLQAINRVHRMGQQKQVNVRYLVCTNTVEETILVIAREKMAKRGATDDEVDHASGSSLALLPEMRNSASGLAAAAAAAAAAAPPAAAAVGAASRSGSDSEESMDEATRLRGRWANRRAARNSEENRAAGRGAPMGHATNDAAPDLRLHELERLFII